MGGAQELRATPRRPGTPPGHSEPFRAATRALKALQAATYNCFTIRYIAGLRATPSYSELLRARGAQELRATPSHSQKLRALGASWTRCKLGKGCLQRRAEFGIPDYSSCSEPAVSGIASSSQPIRVTPSTPSSVLELQARKGLPKTACGFASQIGAPAQSLQARKALPKKAYKFVSQIGAPAQSLPSPELQALLSPHNSTACGQQSPLLRASEVKNSEWRAQIAPASAVCGELGLPSLERETARLGPSQTNDRNDRNDGPPARPKKNK